MRQNELFCSFCVHYVTVYGKAVNCNPVGSQAVKAVKGLVFPMRDGILKGGIL